jgi:hypothetical protein
MTFPQSPPPGPQRHVIDWSNYPYTKRLEPAATRISHYRRQLVIGLCIWVPIAAFWLLAGVVSGYAAFWIPLMIGPFVLIWLAYKVGLGNRRLPAIVVYLLGSAPAIAFPAVQWKWFIGLLILAMIGSYEMVLAASVRLRKAAGESDDFERAMLRVERLTLILISVDAHSAGLDIFFLVLAIVAIVRMRRLSVSLTFLAFGISFVALLFNGDPASFSELSQLGFVTPDDATGWFTLETIAGGVVAWGRAFYSVWLHPR